MVCFVPRTAHGAQGLLSSVLHTVIAVSADVLASLRSACPGNMKKMQFVPNGVVDMLSIPTEKISAEWSSDMFAVVGMIARFEAPKDYFTVVEAATRVHCVNPATHFVLVGEVSRAIAGTEADY